MAHATTLGFGGGPRFLMMPAAFMRAMTRIARFRSLGLGRVGIASAASESGPVAAADAQPPALLFVAGVTAGGRGLDRARLERLLPAASLAIGSCPRAFVEPGSEPSDTSPLGSGSALGADRGRQYRTASCFFYLLACLLSHLLTYLLTYLVFTYFLLSAFAPAVLCATRAAAAACRPSVGRARVVAARGSRDGRPCEAAVPQPRVQGVRGARRPPGRLGQDARRVHHRSGTEAPRAWRIPRGARRERRRVPVLVRLEPARAHHQDDAQEEERSCQGVLLEGRRCGAAGALLGPGCGQRFGRAAARAGARGARWGCSCRSGARLRSPCEQGLPRRRRRR